MVVEMSANTSSEEGVDPRGRYVPGLGDIGPTIQNYVNDLEEDAVEWTSITVLVLRERK